MKTYNEVNVKNETISNTTHEEHTQKLIGYDTKYTHGGENYKGFEIDHIVLANGTIIKYDDEKSLAGYEPKPLNKYCNATLYLKNGTVLDIVIHNEGNKTYQNYGYIKELKTLDNKYQGAYVVGVNKPTNTFEGKVIAIINRKNDIEDKHLNIFLHSNECRRAMLCS